jgi:hypothetical protein
MLVFMVPTRFHARSCKQAKIVEQSPSATRVHGNAPNLHADEKPALGATARQALADPMPHPIRRGHASEPRSLASQSGVFSVIRIFSCVAGGHVQPARRAHPHFL